MNHEGWLAPSMALILLACACGKVATLPTEADAGDDGSTSLDASTSFDASVPPADVAPVSLADFDQRCAVNFDCTLVRSPPCLDGRCWCNDAALNSADLGRYIDALYAEVEASDCRPTPGSRCEWECQQKLLALCIEGRCEALPRPSTLDVNDYDRSCRTSDDCVRVNVDTCHCGYCAGQAIARTALAQFEQDLAAQPACGTRGPCDPDERCGFGFLECRTGQCEWIVTGGPP